MKWNSYNVLFMAVVFSGCIHSTVMVETSITANDAQLTSNVSPQLVAPPPVLKGTTAAGEFYLGGLTTDGTVEVTYPGMNNGDTVGLRYIGLSTYNLAVQTVGATRPLIFKVPQAMITQSVGRSATVTASVGVGDNALVISAPLTVKVINGFPPVTPPPGSPGAVIAENMNNRYKDTRAACGANQPAYYCNGVVIRATQDGNFFPWDPSPTAVKLGAVSFAYMRLDAKVENLYHDSGFTFLPQQAAIAQGKAVDYLCIYAYDASTIVGVRGAQGCGLKPRGVAAADISTCSSVNATTLTGWYPYTKTIPNRDYQCSLSTQNASQFSVSLQVRANRPPNMEALWNELTVGLWAQNIPTKLPLEAFFYKNTTGLTEARHYQTKYKTSTGDWLPIIKLDLNQLNGTPFSYNTGDQAVQPMVQPTTGEQIAVISMLALTTHAPPATTICLPTTATASRYVEQQMATSILGIPHPRYAKARYHSSTSARTRKSRGCMKAAGICCSLRMKRTVKASRGNICASTRTTRRLTCLADRDLDADCSHEPTGL
ncbi:hypothetical protein [Pseudomonas huanghezhanensis]|uniref:hypothetical protein n=1 Tax=Pseudomonas huanghezhanensis TaxID=3002903 RepID=UPI0022859753|nr:hypothetical protein [Pseudomonas sp. BSw22131]